MMLSLPVKYRPLVFEDLIGQELISRFLSSLIKRKQTGRNIIFYGPHGASKTTSLRIYSRALNCELPQPSGSPCNTCDSCTQHLNSRAMDYLEIDATSSSGKDDIQDLLKIAKTPPMMGRYRIIGLDEVQALSRKAWDSLLKTIEEPLDFQVWLFSTTEIAKVLPVIKSRCQCLEVKLLSADQAKQHLKKICTLEGFVYEDAALDIIVFMSKGHPRDLLKNLEQVSFMGDITINNVQVIFNLEFLEPLINLFLALINKETKALRNILTSFKDTSKGISEKTKQFFLFLYYRFIQEVEIEINPVFNLIPSNELMAGWQKLENILTPKVEEKFLETLTKLNELKDNTLTSLEISLLELHSGLHNIRNPVIIGGVPEAPKTMKTRGRKFITDVEEPQTPIVRKEKPPETRPSISSQDLLDRGLSCIELKTESDVTLLEEEAE